jgi:hypothetical protein
MNISVLVTALVVVGIAAIAVVTVVAYLHRDKRTYAGEEGIRREMELEALEARYQEEQRRRRDLPPTHEEP